MGRGQLRHAEIQDLQRGKPSRRPHPKVAADHHAVDQTRRHAGFIPFFRRQPARRIRDVPPQRQDLAQPEGHVLPAGILRVAQANFYSGKTGKQPVLLLDDVLLELDPELAELQWQATRASAEQARLALRDARRRLQEARALAPQQSIAETAVRDLEAEVAEDEALLSEAQGMVSTRSDTRG